MKKNSGNVLISYYNQELKGVAFGISVILILGILNAYSTSLKQLLSSNEGWLIGVFVIAAIVIAMAVKMYQRVTLLKKGLTKILI